LNVSANVKIAMQRFENFGGTNAPNPLVARLPHNDSAPRDCTPLPPRYAPECCMMIFWKMLGRKIINSCRRVVHKSSSCFWSRSLGLAYHSGFRAA